MVGPAGKARAVAKTVNQTPPPQNQLVAKHGFGLNLNAQLDAAVPVASAVALVPTRNHPAVQVPALVSVTVAHSLFRMQTPQQRLDTVLQDRFGRVGHLVNEDSLSVAMVSASFNASRPGKRAITDSDMCTKMVNHFESLQATWWGCWTYGGKTAKYTTTANYRFGYRKRTLAGWLDVPASKSDSTALIIRHHPARCELFRTLIGVDADIIDPKDSDDDEDDPDSAATPVIPKVKSGVDHVRCARPSHLCVGTRSQNGYDIAVREAIESDATFRKLSAELLTHASTLATAQYELPVPQRPKHSRQWKSDSVTPSIVRDEKSALNPAYANAEQNRPFGVTPLQPPLPPQPQSLPVAVPSATPRQSAEVVPASVPIPSGLVVPHWVTLALPAAVFTFIVLLLRKPSA